MSKRTFTISGILFAFILADICGCATHKSFRSSLPASNVLSDLEYFSYKEVRTWLKNNPNMTHDGVDASVSSQIKMADYYYHDSGVGFLILRFRDKSIIFGGFPADMWEAFKKANDRDQFYHSKIRDRVFHIWSQ
jgi:hypothetical protein